MDTKALIHSRTFQLALAQAIIGVIVVFQGAYPALQDVGYIAIVKSLIDVFIRTRSTAVIGGVFRA